MSKKTCTSSNIVLQPHTVHHVHVQLLSSPFFRLKVHSMHTRARRSQPVVKIASAIDLRSPCP
jgi:hypothetical protein